MKKIVSVDCTEGFREERFFIYTRSKIEFRFQIVAGAYSSYVTRAIWKLGFILGWVYDDVIPRMLSEPLEKKVDF